MKDIKGYEGLYAITSCGRVWSYRSKKFLKPRKNNRGYLLVGLYKEGKFKNFLIHRLVAEAYIPNPRGLETVDHIDNNKEHNYIGNLQWMTHKDNILKNHCKKIQCVETGQIFDSIAEAASSVNRAGTNISACLYGRQATCAGYHWKYVQEGL